MWRISLWWQRSSQFPAPASCYRTGFRLWWEHAPPLHVNDVRLTHACAASSVRGRCTSKGAVRMPRVRMPGTTRSIRL